MCHSFVVLLLFYVNSGMDIKFCSNCGMSASGAFSSDSLMSSLACPVGTSCNSS